MFKLPLGKTFDVQKIREDFPILNQTVNDKPLIYFDNASTSQKPKQVIESISSYYNEYNSNVHRGIHFLSEKASLRFEEVREKIRKFINAKHAEEIIFVRGTTEAINLVSYAWGRENIKEGDGVLLTEMEHHSSLVPWQQLALEKKARLNYVGLNDDGTLRSNDWDKYLGGTKIVSVTEASNVLGTINPIKEIVKKAHASGSKVLVDAAQSVPHMPVDVQDLDCDFLAFSGHKMLGPTGIGVLYAKMDVLEQMKPFHYGGSMIKEVHLNETKFAETPAKFEAGTPDIAGVIGLGVAVDYLNNIGMKNVKTHETELTKYALQRLSEVKDLQIYGPKDPKIRVGVISFNLGDIHAHDLSTVLDSEGIAVRSGHHCAMPLHERLGLTASTRASFYLYNKKEEIDVLVNALEKARKVFRLE